MGRAIVRDPKVFLFDEPLSNLDAQLRVQMRVEIKRLQQELGTTSLYVTHDQVEAMTLADRLIVMNAGNVDQIGAAARPLRAARRPLFVAGFIGSPAMNLLPGRLEGGGIAVGARSCCRRRTGEAGRPVVGRAAARASRTGARRPLAVRVDLLERLGADTILHGAPAPARRG